MKHFTTKSCPILYWCFTEDGIPERKRQKLEKLMCRVVSGSLKGCTQCALIGGVLHGDFPAELEGPCNAGDSESWSSYLVKLRFDSYLFLPCSF